MSINSGAPSNERYALIQVLKIFEYYVLSWASDMDIQA